MGAVRFAGRVCALPAYFARAFGRRCSGATVEMSVLRLRKRFFCSDT